MSLRMNAIVVLVLDVGHKIEGLSQLLRKFGLGEVKRLSELSELPSEDDAISHDSVAGTAGRSQVNFFPMLTHAMPLSLWM